MRCLTAGAASAASALLLLLVLLLGACAGSGPSSAPAAPATPATFVAAAAVEMPPPEPREFRAAWVATVAHIDWPSRPGLAPEAQRTEARALLDRAVAIGLNALILQVRPAADAFYASALEPWSEYLTGAQGRAPVPAWDPLAWWVGEAQARGIELHVWLNPYRARHSAATSPLVAPHLAVRQPALVRRYGDQWWIDPGEPAAAAHTLAVVADVVRRYDIDAVHIDDYFYPYPVKAGEADRPFPDDAAFARYLQGGGTLARDDWRRANVDALVQEMQATVRRIKPWVRFGISPFGLGRPDLRPPGVTGFSQYDQLYADVERWLENGWLDYLAPQLYWPIDRAGQAFQVLLDYWIGQNTARRHIWPGLFTSQITRGEPQGPRTWAAQEILDQIALQRARPGASGHIHFSMVALLQDRDGIATRLQQGAYATPALVPATPWLDDQPPPAPVLRLAGPRVEIQPAAGEAAARWVVWRRVGGVWRLTVLPAAQQSFALDGADAVAVSAVDRVGNVSARNFVQLP